MSTALNSNFTSDKYQLFRYVSGSLAPGGKQIMMFRVNLINYLVKLHFTESAVPNNGNVGNQVIFSHSPVLRVLFRCNLFDVYVVSSGFSFKPTSSSTQFSK